MVTLGFAAGLWLSYRLAKSSGLPAEALVIAAAWILIASILGARLLFVALNWHDSTGVGAGLQDLAGGMSFHGGLPAGCWRGALFAWRRRSRSGRWPTPPRPGFALGYTPSAGSAAC